MYIVKNTVNDKTKSFESLELAQAFVKEYITGYNKKVQELKRKKGNNLKNYKKEHINPKFIFIVEE